MNRMRPLLVLFVLLSLLLVSVARASDFPQLVIFGDSLSDPGNHFIAFGTIAQQPFAPIAEDSYAIGGHHFSNGATWAEQLAQAMDVPTSGDPALRGPGVFTNYAVGRARARPGAPVFPAYDLGTQVGLFLSDFGGLAPSDDLYAIFIGSDDLRDALSALTSDPSGATSLAIIQAAVTSVAGNIQALWAAGARAFLILDVPDPSITPAVRALDPGAQFAAALFTSAYNGALDQALNALQGLPQIRFVRLDTNALIDDVLAAPEAAGLTNVEDSCLTFGVIEGAICETPNRYLFWDGIHPTATAHGIIANAALQALASP